MTMRLINLVVSVRSASVQRTPKAAGLKAFPPSLANLADPAVSVIWRGYGVRCCSVRWKQGEIEERKYSDKRRVGGIDKREVANSIL